MFCAISVEQAQRRIRCQQRGDQVAGDRDGELVLEVARRFRSLPRSTIELDATRPVGELTQAILRGVAEVEALACEP